MLCTLANVCMSLPVGTASVERSFSKIKMIKLDSETDYLKKTYLMKISIESLQKLTDKDLEMMIEIWNIEKLEE